MKTEILNDNLQNSYKELVLEEIKNYLDSLKKYKQKENSSSSSALPLALVSFGSGFFLKYLIDSFVKNSRNESSETLKNEISKYLNQVKM